MIDIRDHDYVSVHNCKHVRVADSEVEVRSCVVERFTNNWMDADNMQGNIFKGCDATVIPSPTDADKLDEQHAHEIMDGMLRWKPGTLPTATMERVLQDVLADLWRDSPGWFRWKVTNAISAVTDEAVSLKLGRSHG